MIDYVIHLDSLQPIIHGINCGPAAVFLAGSMWACDGIFRPYVSTRLNAEALVAWEHILSLLPLSPLIYHYLIKERKPLNFKIWICMFVIGIGADAIANTFITLGYSLGHVALVALLQQSQPIFGLLGACLALREEGHGKVAIPLALGAFAGLFLMMWPYAREARQENGAWDGMKAGLYGLGAAIIWASETVIGRWLLHHSSPTVSSLELLTYRQFIGLVFLVFYVYVLSARPLCTLTGMECLVSVQPTLWQTAVIGIIALIELTSHFLYYVGLNHTPASIAVIMELAHPLLILTVVPSLTNLFDPEYVRDPLEAEQICGAVILICSTALLGIHAARMEAKEVKLPTAHTSNNGTPAPPEDIEMLLAAEPKSDGRRLQDAKLPRKAPSGQSKFSSG